MTFQDSSSHHGKFIRMLEILCFVAQSIALGACSALIPHLFFRVFESADRCASVISVSLQLIGLTNYLCLNCELDFVNPIQVMLLLGVLSVSFGSLFAQELTRLRHRQFKRLVASVRIL